MKRTLVLAVFFLASLTLSNLKAGNPDRVGQSGAYELLINPWPATTGMHGANMAKIGGLEAIRNNVAGLVNTRNLEFTASRSKYLLGTGINMNAFGFSKTLGERNTNAIAVSVTSFNIGDVERTTVRQPEGGLGTFTPSIVNVSAGYAKRFSPSGSRKAGLVPLRQASLMYRQDMLSAFPMPSKAGWPSASFPSPWLMYRLPV
jgi:hypothetical protein